MTTRPFPGTRKVNRGPAPFYPNDYYPDTFTLLVFAPQ